MSLSTHEIREAPHRRRRLRRVRRGACCLSRWPWTEFQPADRIVLVHATAPASNWLGTPYYERAVAQSHIAAERVLDEMRPIAEQVETPIEFSVLEGPPAEALIRAAAVRDADEIVVGSRGLGRIRGALGSVSPRSCSARRHARS